MGDQTQSASQNGAKNKIPNTPVDMAFKVTCICMAQIDVEMPWRDFPKALSFTCAKCGRMYGVVTHGAAKAGVALNPEQYRSCFT